MVHMDSFAMASLSTQCAFVSAPVRIPCRHPRDASVDTYYGRGLVSSSRRFQRLAHSQNGARTPSLRAAAVPPTRNVECEYTTMRVLDIPVPETSPIEPATGPPIVIIVPGYGSDASEYRGLQSELQRALGASAAVEIVPVRWHTWVRTVGGRPVTPVLSLIDATVNAAIASASAPEGQSTSIDVSETNTVDRKRVVLIGHSAGGWISRIWLSRTAEYDGRTWSGADRVGRLICLGTPQTSAEPVTRTNMMFVAEKCADCAEAPDVDYVCIGGSGLQVVPIPNDQTWKWRPWEKTWFARLSYELTDDSGNADVGDGMS